MHTLSRERAIALPWIAMVRVSCGVLVVLVACGGDTVDHLPDAPPAPGCEAPTGPGTEHSSGIQADETWTLADSPHIVTFSLSIGATLTIEPCAVVRIRKGFSISIGGTTGFPPAALVAHGESIDNGSAPPTVRPVRFERDAADAPWGSIRVFPTGTLDLEHVVLTGGGDPATAQNFGGTVIAVGSGGSTPLVRSVRVVDVTIEGSGGFGANLQTRAAFTADSTGLTIHGAGALPAGGSVDTRFPIYVEGAAVSSIPDGTYTGNAIDEIAVANAALIAEDVTIHDRGVPYRSLGTFGMSPAQSAANGGLLTLTIEGGVTMKFPNGGATVHSLRLGTSNGMLPQNLFPVRLVAAGSLEKPITLTSAEATPAAGDWVGIEWAAGPPAGNEMRNVLVEFAGGDSGTLGFGCGPADNDAALIFRNWRPDDAFITDSAFVNSAAGGITSGWRSDLTGPSFLGNTFTAIGNGCKQSRWADANGSCPTTPPICL